MGLLDDVQTRQATARRGGTCTVSTWLATLTTEQRQDFAAALDSDADSTTIHAVISTKYGFERGVSTVQRHRRRECDCGPR